MTDRWVLLPTDYDGGLSDDQLVAVCAAAASWIDLLDEVGLYRRWFHAATIGLDKLGVAHAAAVGRLGIPAVEKLLYVKARREEPRL